MILAITTCFTENVLNVWKKEKEPNRNFFMMGYVVNAIIDAAYKSAKNKNCGNLYSLKFGAARKACQKVSNLTDYDADNYFGKRRSKRTMAPKKLFLKNKTNR